ncbi:hypothetical protein LTR56_018224 [Elasticomyces elasticus]|nr:hypothetical protein LTR56_018224 [Elasticomyces elasticus]KAK3664042.1 hypothetical protein LTR22_005005 [Elasticomyces elasticus]KAK4927611.1 hypothetical protein LTR49_005479 [Elasticomyces elasticus]KAK5766983.1 hypothetical protein LTS12_002747 [Elasticomyces elasticus]
MVQTRQMAKLAAMAPRDLSKLPNEILTMVLSYLSTEEIVRVKEISRRFSNVIIDCDSTLFRPHAQAAVQKLVDASNRVMQTDGKQRAFYQQLAIFFSHRGIQAKRQLRKRDLLAFLLQWQKFHDPLPDEKNSRHIIAIFVENLLDFHVHFHSSADEQEGFEHLVITSNFDDLAGHASDAKIHLPWTTKQPYTDKNQSLIRDKGLVDPETGAVPKVIRDSTDSGAHLPRYPLTRLGDKLVNGEFKGMRDGKRRRQAGCCSQQRLQIVLGGSDESLPTLPWTRHFAYCISDSETYRAFLAERKAVGKGVKTSWQFRARLLDRMFLY